MDAAASAGAVKRKRGRPPKNPALGPVNKAAEKEKLCFLCFEDGGKLAACGRRDCSKVYHPDCVGRDEAYFQQSGKWTCGWHICSSCLKAAHYMCYTCMYSLCSKCIKKDAFICIRGSKGFCETCVSTIRLIESKEDINNIMIQLDFDDKKTFGYLFKMYWFDLKGKLALSFEEFAGAESQRKESATRKEEKSDGSYDAIDDHESSSDCSSRYCEGRALSSNMTKKCSRNILNEEVLVKKVYTVMPDDSSWASEELLEFVAHMRDGDKSILSYSDLQDLLLEYIKWKNLHHPHNKNQILCDQRLQKLFGIECIGHFEILRLLKSHLITEAPQVTIEDEQGGVNCKVDPEGYAYAAAVMSSDKRRKMRKRVYREPQTNLDDYAAIDVHNINLIYLRRNLMEYLLEDTNYFKEKVVGSFVRIRIQSADHGKEIYRLVQVIGTHKATKQYKIGNKMADTMLEIINLDKKEVIPIHIISNQQLTKDECGRLRQSIRLGFVSRLTVGEFLEKARVLHGVKVNYGLESEKVQVSHLRDRASEKGHRKELRLCIEKLQLLSNPEEQKRRLNEVQEVHSDPKMDPNYESPEEEEKPDDMRESNSVSASEISSNRMMTVVIPPGREGSVPSNDWNSLEENSNPTWESNRSPQNQDAGNRTNGSSWHQGKGVFKTNSWEAQNTQIAGSIWGAGLSDQLARGSVQSYGVPFRTTSTSLSVDALVTSKASQSELTWHYEDPTGRIQGPFKIVDLSEWSRNGFFPPELRIWRKTEKQDESILLTDALSGKFERELSHPEPQDNSFPQVSKATTPLDTRANKCKGGWGVDNDVKWVNKKKGGNWNAGWNDTMVDKSENSSVPNVINCQDGTAGMSLNGWKSSKDINAFSGQHESHISSWQTAVSPTSLDENSQTSSPKKTYNSFDCQLAVAVLKDELTLSNDVGGATRPCFTNFASCLGENKWSENYSQTVGSHTQRLPIDENNLDIGNKLPDVRDRSAKGNMAISGDGYGSNCGSDEGAIGEIENISSPNFFQSEYAKSWGDSAATKSNNCSMPSPAPSGWDVCADSALGNNKEENIIKVGWGTKVQEDSNVHSAWEMLSQKEATRDRMSKKCSRWDVGPDSTLGNSKENIREGSLGREVQVKSNGSNGWETLLEAKTNTSKGCETSGNVKSSSNTGWGKPTDGERNRVAPWQTPIVKNTSVTGWETSAQKSIRVKTGWKTPEEGNINSTMGWGISQQRSIDESPGWRTPAARNTNATLGWGSFSEKTTDATLGWKTPAPADTNASSGWDMSTQIRTRTDQAALDQEHTQKCSWKATSQQTSNPKKRSSTEETGWGTALEKNVTWDPESWNTESNHGGYRRSGQRQKCLDGKDSETRHDSWRLARDKKRSGGKECMLGNPRNQRENVGLCRYYESGYCKKGRSYVRHSKKSIKKG